jgi:hypothetical protein
MGFHSALSGADLHSPSREQVENNTGTNMPALVAVTYSSIGRAFPNVVLAGTSDIVRGITATAINTGSTGYIAALGLLNGINTSSWSVGTLLYVGGSGSLITTPSGLPIATVLRRDATSGMIYVNAVGVNAADISAASFPAEAELEIDFLVAYPRPYKHFSYSGTGDIVDFDTYADSSMTLHLLNKHFTYGPDGDLASVVTTNLLTGLSKTKTVSYDGSGEIASIQES